MGTCGCGHPPNGTLSRELKIFIPKMGRQLLKELLAICTGISKSSSYQHTTVIKIAHNVFITFSCSVSSLGQKTWDIWTFFLLFPHTLRVRKLTTGQTGGKQGGGHNTLFVRCTAAIRPHSCFPTDGKHEPPNHAYLSLSTFLISAFILKHPTLSYSVPTKISYLPNHPSNKKNHESSKELSQIPYTPGKPFP